MRTYIMGDIHGAYKALKQCLERAEFDYRSDTLIQLGDITDGYDEVYECVEELLQLDRLIAIRGNHDEWFRHFIESGVHPDSWRQGGLGSLVSYLRPLGKEHLVQRVLGGFTTALNSGDVPESHQRFFRNQQLFYVDNENNCFVHAGFDRKRAFKGQNEDCYYWDRDLWSEALSFQASQKEGRTRESFYSATPFQEIFIGHTSTRIWGTDQPMKAANIYNLDTGAGSDGRLTLMDLESKAIWQSDPVKELYAG